MKPAVKNGSETDKRDNAGKFVKGNPGGPGRPPKELCIPEILRSLGEEVSEETKKTRLETVLEMVYLLALAGNLDCMKFIAERTEGKVKDTLAVERVDVPPIVLRMPTPEELQALRGLNSAPNAT